MVESMDRFNTIDLSERPELEPVIKRVKGLVRDAKEVSLENKNLDVSGRERVTNAIDLEFAPYALETEVIAADIISPPYEAFTKTVRDYLGDARVGYIACPDGRITHAAMGDARVISGYRKLRGMPRTRPSSRTGEPVPVNPTLSASITASLQSIAEQGKKPVLIEFIGPHIYSSHPDHGCGAAAGELSGVGSGIPVTNESMWDGGLSRYFTQAEETGAYDAFTTVAERAGGKGIAFSVVHDIHSQGLILGLHEAWRKLDPSQSLRNNLLRLESEGRIVMTEILAKKLHDRIVAIAQKFDRTFSPQHPKDLRNFLKFRDTSILIGSVALELTKTLEKEGDSKFVGVRDLLGEKVVAYHLFRNAVYQVVGGIKPEHHALVHHPERVLRAGVIGADFNVKTIPFIIGTPDHMDKHDIDDTFALYQLMARFLPEQNVDLDKEARLVMVTGSHNPDEFKNADNARSDLTTKQGLVMENAAAIRTVVSEADKKGYVVILPIIHHKVNRSMSVIVD